MEHAASPSLISLGLTSDSSEGSSLRWGLVSSCALHALVIVIAMFVRFQSDSEQPFRTIDVALISLPTVATTAPSKPIPSKTKKAAVPTPPKKVAPSPTPTARPVEPTLPPLPTETAPERLSESLGGAINSIRVPQRREMNPSTLPAQEPAPQPTEDQSPLIDNLRLPSAPPTIARPKRLQPAEPIKPPSSTIPPPTSSAPKKAPAPVKAPAPPAPARAEKVQPTVKPAPSIPSLSEVTPFTMPKQAATPPKTPKTSNLESTLKRHIPQIQTPPSKPKVPTVTRKQTTPKPKPKASTPKISAPLMTEIPKTSRPQASVPAQPKMSDTVRKLMEGLKSTTPRPAPNKVPHQPINPPPTVTPSVSPSTSAIDQQIAKLSIPEVKPVESIKQRLQLLEVQGAGSPGSSTSKASPGKNRYLAMVEDRIDHHWVAPPLLASQPPVVVVKFHIARSGEISRIQIAESSGHAHYDSAAQRAVQAVNPLPSFPSDISDSYFDVTYRFIKD